MTAPDGDDTPSPQTTDPISFFPVSDFEKLSPPGWTWDYAT